MAKQVEGFLQNTVDRSTDFANWRLRSYKLQNGYVVEVRSKDEIGSFEKFSAALREHIPRASLNPGNVGVEYVSLGNDRMSFTFPEKRILNGKPVDLGKTKLFEGPFLNAEVGSEMLVLTYRGERMVLDFKNVAHEEKPRRSYPPVSLLAGIKL